MEGTEGPLAHLPIGVGMLPCSEFRIMDALRGAVALTEVKAFVIDDVIPDLVRYLRGIQN